MLGLSHSFLILFVSLRSREKGVDTNLRRKSLQDCANTFGRNLDDRATEFDSCLTINMKKEQAGCRINIAHYALLICVDDFDFEKFFQSKFN